MWAKTCRKPTTASHNLLWARDCWFPVQGPWKLTHTLGNEDNIQKILQIWKTSFFLCNQTKYFKKSKKSGFGNKTVFWRKQEYKTFRISSKKVQLLCNVQSLDLTGVLHLTTFWRAAAVEPCLEYPWEILNLNLPLRFLIVHAARFLPGCTQSGCWRPAWPQSLLWRNSSYQAHQLCLFLSSTSKSH